MKRAESRCCAQGATVGQAHAVLWIAAAVLFFLPLAMLVAAIVAALIVACQFGTRAQEAYQLIDRVVVVLYAVVYIAMFAIPLAGRRDLRRQIPGLVVTVLAVVFALVPIVHVASDLVFAAKVVAIVMLFNVTGLAVFRVTR